jgi:biotin carboxyl carrier protein
MNNNRNRYIATIGQNEFDIGLTRYDEDYEIEYNGSKYNVSVDKLANGKFLFKINDTISEVNIARNNGGLDVFIDGKELKARVERYSLAELRKKAGTSVEGPEDKIIKAPMPGMVLSIPVKAGDAIKKGSTLLIIEAMKMENMIKAPHDGTVRKIFVEPGHAVDKNNKLVELE